MPYRPNIPCKHPGCGKLVAYGQKYCDEHKPLHPEVTRSASKRGYGSKWQRASKAYLKEILCVKFARGMENTFKLRWLTIKNRTEVIKSCSGIRTTGKRCVSRATIKKQERKTVHLHISTKSSYCMREGRSKSLQ